MKSSRKSFTLENIQLNATNAKVGMLIYLQSQSNLLARTLSITLRNVSLFVTFS